VFDGLKNLGNLPELMRQASRLQEQMKALQQRLLDERIEFESGGGAAKATVNGRMELVSLKLDPTKVDMDDRELVEDLVLSAVRGAQLKANARVAELAKQEFGGLNLPPGLIN
jgi:DNA-binding YbaB/EbfC family protein